MHWGFEIIESFYIKHLLVGLTEDIDSFVKLLQVLVPQFFNGAYQLFHNDEKNLSHVRKTRHKDPVRTHYIII